ncbi:hypothetical protein [Paramagnetospirillum caucaseum]|uniref:hypothetical protein n=1 Tax=Paramagnetospirillum caucaseum TaxID=1244869 RepID=UPI00126812E9|nr:hypothetical protein [Paramagnetospirillum caucaseum]
MNAVLNLGDFILALRPKFAELPAEIIDAAKSMLLPCPKVGDLLIYARTKGLDLLIYVRPEVAYLPLQCSENYRKDVVRRYWGGSCSGLFRVHFGHLAAISQKSGTAPPERSARSFL